MILPKRIYYEENIKNYPLGTTLLNKYKEVPSFKIENHNNILEMRENPNSEFGKMKQYLIIGTRKTHKYVPNSKTSDFLVPYTSSGCSAMCLYCYLVCNYNKCSYLRLFVNRDQIFEKLKKTTLKADRELTFEIGSNSDLVLENSITGNLEWTINEFAKIDINILIPQTLKNIVIPKAVLRAHSKGEFNFQELFENKSIGTFTLDDMMDFSYEIALGDESISKEEFLELTKTAQKLIMYKDKYILLNPDDVKDLVKKLNSVDKIEMTNVKLLHGALTKQLNGFEFDYDEAFEKAIKNIINIEDIEIPESLTGTLRPYQVSGYKWLYSNCRKGFGSCIADDMGLGKTIQVLSLVLKLKEEGRLEKPVLCVVPTTLAGNWVKECQKFAPSIKTCIYHGLDRELDFSADMIITTYAILRMEIKELLDHEWSIVVIDEAQNIKNPTTAQTSAVKALKTPHCIAMTGTPIENRLSELWSIFDFANKGYLGSLGDFQKIYSNQIEKEKDIEAAQRLKRATSPFILRRLKTDKSIIDDLPEKMVLDDYCYLSKEQAALYEKTLENTMKSVQSSSGITRRGNILKLITSLKQICNHPAHYTKSKNFKIEESGKMGHTMELLRNIFMNDEKALIFSQYKEMGAILCKVINEEFNIDPIFFQIHLLTIKEILPVQNYEYLKRDTRLILMDRCSFKTVVPTFLSETIWISLLWWGKKARG